MQGDFAEALGPRSKAPAKSPGSIRSRYSSSSTAPARRSRSILKDPVRFIKNLFGAVGDGIANFFKNIKKHLIEGVIGWLTGALSEVNLTGPFEFRPKGILMIVLQILGLTYANIKARVIKKLPAAAKMFDVVEKGYRAPEAPPRRGPGRALGGDQGQLSNLKETVMGAIRSWLITTVIKEGIIWLLSLHQSRLGDREGGQAGVRPRDVPGRALPADQGLRAVGLRSGRRNRVRQLHQGHDRRSRTRSRACVPVLISLLASLVGLGGIAQAGEEGHRDDHQADQQGDRLGRRQDRRLCQEDHGQGQGGREEGQGEGKEDGREGQEFHLAQEEVHRRWRKPHRLFREQGR